MPGGVVRCDVVAFARRNEVFVLSDLAYAEVYFDDRLPPPSVLQVPGALDVTVEFTSMSKTFSMAGQAAAAEPNTPRPTPPGQRSTTQVDPFPTPPTTR